jgi:hypothetical protein
MFQFQSKTYKKWILALSILLILGVASNWLIKYKISSTLKTGLPPTVKLSYNDLSVNALSRSITLKNVRLQLLDSVEHSELVNLTIKKFKLSNFGVLDYLFDHSFHVNTIEILEPEGYMNSRKDTLKVNSQSLGETDISEIGVKHVIINKASFQVRDVQTDSIQGAISDFNLNLRSLKAVPDKKNIKISYDNYVVNTGAVFLALGPLNTLKIETIRGTNTMTRLKNTSLKTKYSPHVLPQYISHEKDYYDLAIDSIAVYSMPKDFDTGKLQLHLSKMCIKHPELFVYRDKLLADDLSIKPMFSEMFRKIPIAFQIDSFQIDNAFVKYKERVHSYNDGGELFFDDSHIKITNLSNSEDKQPIDITIKSRFCGKSEVKANWVMDVLNKDDEFSFSADIANVDLADINTFSQPNLNTKMQGKMRHLYYTISGNKYKSTIAIKSEYSDIKITVLDKTHHNKNKFYSSVANLIVSKKSKNKSSNFKTSKVLVDRDMTKSHINFIFKNVKEGLAKVFL